MTGRPCIFYADEFLRHGSEDHIERPSRLARTMARLRDARALERFDVLRPDRASDDLITAVHAPEYLAFLRARGVGALDPDTAMTEGSMEAALLAAGAGVGCVDEAAGGRGLAYGLVRPPGHHAMPADAMGFCLLNNAAIGAAHALRSAKRVLIVDWDVHHGNGTEHMFYSSPDVLYFSVHQYPWYPGTGKADDTGVGEGQGFNVDVPLPARSTDADYLNAFRRVLLPIADDFRPELVVVSAGFDAYDGDPLGGMHVTPEGFQAMAYAVRGIRGGRGIAALLEGGYSEALPRCVEASIKGFLGEDVEIKTPTTDLGTLNIDYAVHVQKEFWRL